MKNYLEKVFQDRFYCHTYRYLGMKGLAPAGFLYDKNENDKTILEINIEKDKVFNINMNKILSNIQRLSAEQKEKIKKDKAYILLSTGSFNPVHEGHIEMLECARREIEKEKVVLGGFLSVSHDSYVFTKDERFQITASERSFLCDKILDGNDWITTDTWEALENDYAINFTDVIERMKWLINKKLSNLDIEVDIVYVFGSDNYTFLDAFISEGYCVCVPRKSEDIEKCTIKQNQLYSFFLNNPQSRIHVSGVSYDMSSTRIRNKEAAINKNLSEIWQKIENKNLFYLIRNDSFESTNYYREKIPDYLNKIENFKNGIFKIFNEFFNCIELKVEKVKIDNSNIINLDTWTEIDNAFKLRASRVFKVNDSQIFSKEIYFSQPAQLEEIKKSSLDNYTLVDDDIATGFTTKTIIEELSPKKCIQIYSLNPYKNFYDVVDIRDFIIGAQYGGLFCKYQQKYMRVPYLFPFVNLITRAKIPYSKEIDFTKKIIELNLDFFKDSDIKIKDTNLEFINFCNFLEISSEETIDYMLKKIKP